MRPSSEENFIAIAHVVSLRGTCARRLVGCVLVDCSKHILATGYNGPATGLDHCIDHPCGGAGLPSGVGLDKCEAIHAEANALLQCSDVNLIDTCYVTASPCIHCVKLLMNTGCRRIIFTEEYPGSEECARLWHLKPGRQWLKYEAS